MEHQDHDPTEGLAESLAPSVIRMMPSNKLGGRYDERYNESTGLSASSAEFVPSIMKKFSESKLAIAPTKFTIKSTSSSNYGNYSNYSNNDNDNLKPTNIGYSPKLIGMDNHQPAISSVQRTSTFEWSDSDDGIPCDHNGLVLNSGNEMRGYGNRMYIESNDNIDHSSESSDCSLGYDYPSLKKVAEPVKAGMELTEDEIAALCDFVDGDAETVPMEVINHVLDKVVLGGAVLDNDEPRYINDL